MLLARVLRAIRLSKRVPSAAEDVLDIVDRRTLAKILTAAGGTAEGLPADENLFLVNQTFVPDHRAIEAVRNQLFLLTSEDRDPPSSSPIASPNTLSG